MAFRPGPSGARLHRFESGKVFKFRGVGRFSGVNAPWRVRGIEAGRIETEPTEPFLEEAGSLEQGIRQEDTLEGFPVGIDSEILLEREAEEVVPEPLTPASAQEVQGWFRPEGSKSENAARVSAAMDGAALPSGFNFAPSVPFSINQISGRRSERDTGPKRIPPGAAGVQVHPITEGSQVWQFLERKGTAKGVGRLLENHFRKTGPFEIWQYQDALRGSFRAIDVGRFPRFLSRTPLLQEHEKRVIRKILKMTTDVKIVLTEGKKTPDLLINGIPTELKSWFVQRKAPRPPPKPSSLLKKANVQVMEFSFRHGIREGQAFLTVSDPKKLAEIHGVVSPEDVIQSFVRANKHSSLVNIFILWGDQLHAYERTSRGKYGNRTPEFPIPENFEGHAPGTAGWGMNWRAWDGDRRIRLSPEEREAGLAFIRSLKELRTESLPRGGPRRIRRAEGKWRSFVRRQSKDLADAILPMARSLFPTLSGSAEKKGGRRKGGRGRGDR